MGASVFFDKIALNDKDELLFCATHEIPGTPSYSSLFYAKVGKTETAAPQIITCFPERMELLLNGTILQLRNRYGTAHYNTVEDTLTWVTKASGMPVEFTHTAVHAASPDGKYECYVRQTKNAAGSLILQKVKSQESIVLVEDAPFSYETIPVKWAPDSSVALYEKSGSIYFVKPSDSFGRVNLGDSFCKLGSGTINCVEWTQDGNLVYIQGDIIHLISRDELYTRGMYAALVGNGGIIGRLPALFDSVRDTFFVSPNASELVVVSSERTVSYYSIEKPGCAFARVRGKYPLTNMSGTPLRSYALWSASGKVALWLDMIDYSSGKKSCALYTLESGPELVLQIKSASLRPVLSPDGRYLAFTGSKSLYIYDTAKWKEIARLDGERIHSFAWASSSLLYAGGEKTVRLWDFTREKSLGKTLLLSSAQMAFWDGTSIYAGSSESGKIFSYAREKGSWFLSDKKPSLYTKPSDSNGRFRVFAGKSQNNLYANSVFVRSLASPIVTYPIYKESELSNPKQKRVALLLDACDNAEGLASVLEVLNEFKVKATFFINGEFIRRYPEETKQIVAAGYECASSFYTYANLLEGNFVIDSAFIKRGLARNEDEFYSVTASELSPLWHAPFYKASEKMKLAGKDSGYRYIDAFTRFGDRVSYEMSVLDRSKKYYDAALLIDMFAASLEDGRIIPINVGRLTGTRSDYLYEKLDLLIAAILDSGYKIVDIRDFIEE